MTIGKNPWQSLYGYPSFGLGLYGTSLGNDEIHGFDYAVFPWFKYTFIDSRRFNFSSLFGLGLGYATKKYDSETNPYNVAVGSHWNIHFQANFMAQFRITEKSDIIREIDVSRIADTLVLENNFSAQWLRPGDNPIQVDLYCDSLKRIVLNESCNLTSSGPLHSDEIGLIAVSRLNIVDLEFNANTVFYWNNFPCNGTIVFKGETDNLKIWNTALMQVDASELISNYVLVENNSGVDCEVHANEYLDYSISGAGNIIVSGNPELSPGILSGSGQLILIE